MMQHLKSRDSVHQQGHHAEIGQSAAGCQIPDSRSRRRRPSAGDQIADADASAGDPAARAATRRAGGGRKSSASELATGASRSCGLTVEEADPTSLMPNDGRGSRAGKTMMDAANYQKAKKNPGDASIVETQITTDGEANFSYAKRLNDDDRKALKKDSKDDKHKDGQRVPSIVINWAKDSKKFAVVRRDERKVNDLWVINALSTPRPTLETYRYAMPGEPNIAQPQLEVFDVASKGRVQVKAEQFKDGGVQPNRPGLGAHVKEHTGRSG